MDYIAWCYVYMVVISGFGILLFTEWWISQGWRGWVFCWVTIIMIGLYIRNIIELCVRMCLLESGFTWFGPLHEFPFWGGRLLILGIGLTGLVGCLFGRRLGWWKPHSSENNNGHTV